MDSKQFVNGFSSWQETHFEIVSAIAIDLNSEDQRFNVLKSRYETQGTGGAYELAEELTNKFEAKFAGESWTDLDFFFEIENFIDENLI